MEKEKSLYNNLSLYISDVKYNFRLSIFFATMNNGKRKAERGGPSLGPYARSPRDLAAIQDLDSERERKNIS